MLDSIRAIWGSKVPISHRSLEDLKRIISGKGQLDVLAAANFLRLNGIFVEVGTFGGKFAEQICRFVPVKKLICVDPYESYNEFEDGINFIDLEKVYQDAQLTLQPFGDRVSFCRAFSREAAATFPDQTLDFVYIDANHRYEFVSQDLDLWFPKIRSGGLLCGDDVVDIDDAQRNGEGNITMVWARDETGNPTSWGTYGVFAALRDFAARHRLDYLIDSGQFYIIKP